MKAVKDVGVGKLFTVDARMLQDTVILRWATPHRLEFAEIIDADKIENLEWRNIFEEGEDILCDYEDVFSSRATLVPKDHRWFRKAKLKALSFVLRHPDPHCEFQAEFRKQHYKLLKEEQEDSCPS